MSAGTGHGAGLAGLRKQRRLCHSRGPSLPLAEKGLDPGRGGVCVCVVSGVGGEKGLLALRGCKD